MIDLRSDTGSKPTQGMLDAMMSVTVGPDIYGEDPTVLQLEQTAAALFGKEAGLYCVSGTMTNQIAIKVHTQPGDEVICAENAHIYKYEGGGMAFNSGVQGRVLPGEYGRLKATQVAEAINSPEIHFPRTGLMSIENTHNRGGGAIHRLEDIEEISKVCKDNSLPFHLDGARIFNALVETGTSAKEMGSHFDSVSICLSKGLGCPVGSLLLGSKEFIQQAQRIRKVLGGGWRQAGHLAAAGLYALEHHVNRLKVDHQNAKTLAGFMKTLPYMDWMMPVETNIIIFFIKPGRTAAELVAHLEKNHIYAFKASQQSMRFVTHIGITTSMIQEVCEVMAAFNSEK